MAVTTLNHNGSATRRDGLEVIATFDDYAGAQAAVDQLSDDGFPVDRVRIVGDGLMVVEDVTGRRDSRRATVEAAGYGAFVAGWLGLIFGLLDWYDPAQSALALTLYGIVFGGVFGALTGWLAHRSTRGARDFSSVSSMTATRYQVLADRDVAARARTRLAVVTHTQ